MQAQDLQSKILGKLLMKVVISDSISNRITILKGYVWNLDEI